MIEFPNLLIKPRFELTIKGRVISKKNNKRWTGKYLISSSAYLQFESDVLKEITRVKKIKKPYAIKYDFYMKGKGATDIDNQIASINDILQKALIISDDKHILSIQANKYLNCLEYETVVKIY